MRYVIAGAGPAGVIAAETIRRLDSHGTISLISDEPVPPYSRMAIPYMLMEKIGEAGTYLRKDPQHYKALAIDVRSGRVATVDAARGSVTLASGGELHFDRLLVCTGATPVRPPIPGVELGGVYPCWTLAEARQILQRAQRGTHVVLIGAGFIGCIILESLAVRGVRLTVIEAGDRMVPRMMNQTAGNLIKAWCEKKGIAVHTSTTVNAIEHSPANPRALNMQLSNGRRVEADVVITATGVRPNTDLLANSGVQLDDGVLVNQHLQSNVANVYAAGDVAKGRDFSTGGYAVHAIQPTAAEHGRVAGQNMAGKTTPYAGSLIMNVLDTVGLIASSFGQWMGVNGGERAELTDAERFRYINLQFRDDVLVGATSLGLTEHVGVLRGLIQGKVRLGQWKRKLMDDPTRIMEAYLARNCP